MHTTHKIDAVRGEFDVLIDVLVWTEFKISLFLGAPNFYQTAI